MVPNGWEVKKLEDLCAPDAPITYGVLKPGEYCSNGIPLLQIKDLSNGHVSSQDLHLISKELDEEYKRSRILKNDILISLVGTIGRVAKFELSSPANIHRNLGRVRTDYHEFIFHFLNSDVALKLMGDSSSGSSQSALNLSTLRAMKVPFPPFKEQQKIAQILSTWDQAISATEKLLENSQQQKKTLMQQLLTGKRRLLDENGVRFSGVWKHIKLRSLIKEIKRDKEENPNNIELLTVKLHNKGAVASGKFPNSTEGGRPYYKRFAGELIIGRQNLHNGGVAIVPSECNGLIASNAISSFEALNDCDINFILSIMSTSHFRYLIDNLTGGTGQKEVSVRELLNVFVLIPSVEEQQKIAKVLTIADQEIETLQKKLDCLKQEKKALMQQLLTGKKRVKVAA